MIRAVVQEARSRAQDGGGLGVFCSSLVVAGLKDGKKRQGVWTSCQNNSSLLLANVLPFVSLCSDVEILEQ